MRKACTILTAALLAGCVAGCAPTSESLDQLFTGDTIIQVPLKPDSTTSSVFAPTDPPASMGSTSPSEVTAAESSSPKTASTGKTTSKSSSSGSTSSGSSSSKKTSSSKTSTSKSKATTPKETTPAQTVPVETVPMETNPVQIEPTELVPALTEPAETAPPETEIPEPTVYTTSGYAPGSLEYALADQINTLRVQAGQPSLAFSTSLSCAAAMRAYEISVSWSHTRPGGRDWASVLPEYGIGYAAASEHLVYTAGFDAAAIAAKWMETNADALLNADVTTIGVGAYAQDGVTFLAAILIGP